MSDYSGKRILLLDGITSQCLEYTKAFNALGCETTVLCNDRFDTCYASRHPRHKILGISSVNDLSGTEEWIINLVESGNYDIVIPFTEYSASILSRKKKELSKYAHLIVNDYEVFEGAQDKNNVMRICAENNLPHPKTLFNLQEIDDITASGIQFPIILKPSHGFGSHGFHKIQCKEDLIYTISKFNIPLSDFVVQECLPIESLVLSDNIFIDKNGEIKSSFLYGCYRVYPIDGGSGILNISFNRPEIHAVCAKLVKKLNLRGPIGVDLMIDSRDDTAKILEVNVRPLACAKIGFLAGVNPAQQILEDLYGNYVTPMLDYKNDIRVRRSQIDWMWFIKSPNRFKASPSWFDRKNTTDQLFSFDDPLPWFAFFIYGIRKFIRERKER